MRKIIGFTTGYFDIMHPGHILMLEECKRYCDYLIVGVNNVENWKTDSWEQPDGEIIKECSDDSCPAENILEQIGRAHV